MDKTNIRTRNKKVNYNEAKDEDEDEQADQDLDISEEEYAEDKKVIVNTNSASRKKRKSDDINVDGEDDDYDLNSDSEFNDEEEEKEDDDEDEDLDDIEKDEEIKTGKKRKADRIIEKTKTPKKEKAPKEKKEKVLQKEKAVKPPKKEKPVKPPKKEKLLLDPEFNLEQSYFYQNLPDDKFEEIKAFVANYFKDAKNDNLELKTFFQNYELLRKGDHNIHKLRRIITEQANLFTHSEKFFKSFNSLINFIMDEFHTVKPSVLECHFFPNLDNEAKVVNMIRTCKKTLDIAIFTLTNDKIFAGIEEAFNRGVNIRVIADDECCKMMGSDIIRCAALGIPVKTDSDVKAHMHHKFCVLDNSVLITGSFNWTVQAVKQNQENILFYENRELAAKYTAEFNRLWNLFTAVVGKEQSQKILFEDQEKKRIIREQKEKEREQKKKEKEASKKG